MHCFPMGLPYRSMHSAHLCSICSVSVKSFSYWRQKLLFRTLSGLLEFIVGNITWVWHCESKLCAILVLQALSFLPLLLLSWSWTSVCSRLTSNFFDLAVMAEQSSPSAAFLLSLPFLCICYASCCSLTTLERSLPHHRWASCAKSWTKAGISLLKLWCSSGMKATKNHILMFSRHKTNEK